MLYNFSLEGAGIQNWYKIFFEEIVQLYEFDGIIIAASSQKSGIPNFDRKLIAANSYSNANYIRAFDITQQHLPVQFSTDSSFAVTQVISSKKIDQIKRKYEKNKTEK